MQLPKWSLLLVALPALLAAQSETISVDVNLVVLHVAVRDRTGAFVSNLGKDDFRVFEDGHPQSIHLFQHEDVPISAGLVVDNSTSMAPKRRDVIDAARAFVHSSNPEDQLFVVNFNEHPKFGLPPGEAFSSSAGELEKALMVMPGGRTALYDAIERSLAHLKEASRDKKVLIVISDGGDNSSHRKLSQVLDAAARSDVIIYTVGVFDRQDEDKNPGVLRRIAHSTGGEALLPAESSDLTGACERIAADIRHQYTIAYAPTNQKWDSRYRTIKVIATNAHDGKLFVRTREGYIAGERQ